MDNFNLYAKYYDLLNSDKDYIGETNYIDALIKKYKDIDGSFLLDLGCGTGIHANLLTQMGYIVDGVDISKQMIELARIKFTDNSNLQFIKSDITDFNTNKHYDIVTSLFHVMSYQNSNHNLIKAIKTAHKHLKANGLFIFDFWYGPGVLTDRPANRIKELENNQIHVKRKAIPELLVNENIVHVNYEIDIEDRATGNHEIIKEKHSMRYFFIKELNYYLQTCGFNILSFFDWRTFNNPDTTTWNVVMIAQKH